MNMELDESLIDGARGFGGSHLNHAIAKYFRKNRVRKITGPYHDIMSLYTSRDKEIARLFTETDTTASQLVKQYGISRQRVFQILEKQGVDTGEAIKRKKDRANRQKREDLFCLAALVVPIAEAHPTADTQDIATMAGTTKARVLAAMRFAGLNPSIISKRKLYTIDESTRKKIVDMFDGGFKPVEISKELQLRPALVSRWLIRSGRRSVPFKERAKRS